MNFLNAKKRAGGVKLCLMLFAASLPGFSAAMGLMLQPDTAYCGKAEPVAAAPPAAAAQRLAGSKASQGQRDIAWAWLGSPTDRYPHTALGSRIHAGSVHVLVATRGGQPQEVIYRLPSNRVFEDLALRLADLDHDGRDEIIVIEADVLRGASVVVLGLVDSQNSNQTFSSGRSDSDLRRFGSLRTCQRHALPGVVSQPDTSSAGCVRHQRDALHTGCKRHHVRQFLELGLAATAFPAQRVQSFQAHVGHDDSGALAWQLHDHGQLQFGRTHQVV